MVIKYDRSDPMNYREYEKWLNEEHSDGLRYFKHYCFLTFFKKEEKKTTDTVIHVVPDSSILRQQKQNVFYEDYETKIGVIREGDFDVVAIPKNTLHRAYDCGFLHSIQQHSLWYYLFRECFTGIFLLLLATVGVAAAYANLLPAEWKWIMPVSMALIVIPHFVVATKNYVGLKKNIWPPVWLSCIINSLHTFAFLILILGLPITQVF